jgi:hypothetical protein
MHQKYLSNPFLQFNSGQNVYKIIKSWHAAKHHKRSLDILSSDGSWWPNICFYCYPNENDANEMPIVVNSTKWTTGANTVPLANSRATGVNTVPVANSAKWATGANTIPVANSTKWATGANLVPVANSTNRATGANTVPAFNSSKWATGANTAPIGMKKEEVKDAMVNSSKWAIGANTIPLAKSTPIVLTKEELKDAVAKSNWTTKNEDSSFTDSSYEESETEEEISAINNGTNSNCSNKDGTSQMVGANFIEAFCQAQPTTSKISIISAEKIRF